MFFFERIKLSVIAGTASAVLISGCLSPAANGSLFFSHLFFGTAIDREYTPVQEDEDEVVFGCWIFELISRIFG